jgi:hypothetical protein
MGLVWVAGSVYFAIAILIGYIYYRFALFLNGRDDESTLKNLWQEILWYLPGGLQRRADLLADRINDPVMIRHSPASGTISGKTKLWEYAQIRQENLYTECARDVFASPLEFWGWYFIVPLLWIFCVPIALITIVKARLA